MVSPRRILFSSKRQAIVEAARRNPTAENKRRLHEMETKIARFVNRGVRLGRGIKLHQLATVPQTPVERQLFEQWESEVKRKQDKGEKITSTKAKELRVKATILRISSQLRKKRGGRNPTHYQILASAAIAYGLDSKELIRIATRMVAIQNRYGKKVPWEGHPLGIYSALRRIAPATGRRLLESVEKLLHAERRVMDAKTITRDLGLVFEKTNDRVQINCVLQLLDTCRLVKKYPTSGQVSMWFHRDYKNPMINYPCVHWSILEQLFLEPKTIMEISHSSHAERSKASTKFYDRAVREMLQHFEEAGLLVKVGKKTVKKIKTRILDVFDLTPYGRALMEKCYKENSLTEELRKLLVGEKRVDNDYLVKYPFE